MESNNNYASGLAPQLEFSTQIHKFEARFWLAPYDSQISRSQ